MRGIAILLLVFACSGKKDGPREDQPYCDGELSQLASAIETTLAGPADADAFARATDAMTRGTMCGPDIAQLVRDWQAHLRARGGEAERRALLVRFDKLAHEVTSRDWRPSPALDQALTAARGSSR